MKPSLHYLISVCPTCNHLLYCSLFGRKEDFPNSTFSGKPSFAPCPMIHFQVSLFFSPGAPSSFYAEGYIGSSTEFRSNGDPWFWKIEDRDTLQQDLSRTWEFGQKNVSCWYLFDYNPLVLITRKAGVHPVTRGGVKKPSCLTTCYPGNEHPSRGSLTNKPQFIHMGEHPSKSEESPLKLGTILINKWFRKFRKVRVNSRDNPFWHRRKSLLSRFWKTPESTSIGKRVGTARPQKATNQTTYHTSAWMLVAKLVFVASQLGFVTE